MGNEYSVGSWYEFGRNGPWKCVASRPATFASGNRRLLARTLIANYGEGRPTSAPTGMLGRERPQVQRAASGVQHESYTRRGTRIWSSGAAVAGPGSDETGESVSARTGADSSDSDVPVLSGDPEVQRVAAILLGKLAEADKPMPGYLLRKMIRFSNRWMVPAALDHLVATGDIELGEEDNCYTIAGQ